MRTTGLVLLSLASASTLVAAKPAEVHNRNSLESLLDRFAHHKNGTAPASAKTVEVPVVVKNETRPAPLVEKKAAPKEEDAPSDKMIKRNRAQKNQENAKRWVWTTAIIQDNTPNAPPVGVNVNQLHTPAVAVTTPAPKLVAPSFPVQSASPKATTTPAAPVVRKPFHQARGVRVDENEHKRWIWANSVIQDDTPTSEVPPIGQNADLLSDPVTRTTPAATLVRPTFPALSSSSSQTPPASQASAPESSPASSLAAPSTTVVPAVAGDVAAATPVVVVPTTPAPAPTSTAHHWWNPKDFFHDVEAGFDKLFHIHHSSTSAATATAAPVVPASEMEKRWVWATGVIQDDTPNAPPIGSNVDLLNSAPANTPAATLVAPSFPALAPVAMFSSQTPRAIAAALPTAASSSSAAAVAQTTPPIVNRMSWKSVHDALLAASSSSAAAAAASSSSVAAAAARPAAQTPAAAAPVVRYTAAQRFAAAHIGAAPARMAKAKRNEA
ncbi:hypothetical protein JCM3770_006387 [Rhodotorula araucariae]